MFTKLVLQRDFIAMGVRGPQPRWASLSRGSGRTQSREPDIFFACGSVEGTLFFLHIFVVDENVEEKEEKVPLCPPRGRGVRGGKAKRHVDHSTAYVLGMSRCSISCRYTANRIKTKPDDYFQIMGSAWRIKKGPCCTTLTMQRIAIYPTRIYAALALWYGEDQ
mgnify:CR=1 FL=1